MKFLAVRLGQLVIVLLAATFLTYAITFVANDETEVVQRILGQESGSPERVAEVEEGLNLDDPLLIRYGKWVGDAVRLDFGYSYNTREEVGEAIGRVLPRTLVLIVYAQLIAILLAIPLGILAAYRANTWIDRGLSTASIAFLAVPNYVVALLLVYIFALQLDLLPLIAATSPRLFDPNSFLLPAMSLAVGQVAVYMRLLRTDMIATLQEDFVGMARAKGLPTRTILLRHALRPSSLSLVTVIGINTGTLIGGTVIVEQIFSLPGMGRLLVEGIFRRDILVVQAVVAVVAFGFVLINFLVDMLYAILDPRVRHARA